MWPENYSDPHEGGEHPEGELAAFALNALDDAEFQAVFNHVIQCPHCQEVLLGFQETSARLTSAAPEVPLPPGLKDRVLNSVTGREDPVSASLPPSDARWSMRRLRRWLAPVSVGALSLLLAVSIGVIALQQQEINDLAADVESERRLVATMSTVLADTQAPGVFDAGRVHDAPGSGGSQRKAISTTEVAVLAAAAQSSGPKSDERSAANDTPGESADAESKPDDMTIANAEKVDQMKQDMAEVVEATVLSAQPETEKVPMSSPMGTEPEAKGVLMVEPGGMRGVLMVSGMPADSYQIWLVRGGHQVLVDRVVVNDDDGTGVKPIELDESIFQFQQVALLPDERHGPTSPPGEQFLSALILAGPPLPPR
ncbi:MAG: hypothetical protein OXE87_17050 [Chloroflexi bacterium]|nr:hypothetical protein [Chloroflexota bacterium]